MTDELDEVRRYVNEIGPPDARTMAAVHRRLSTFRITGARPKGKDETRRIRRVRWASALLIVLAVGAALLVPTLGRDTPRHVNGARLQDRLARLVVDDVNVTVAAGSYDMTYSDTTTPLTTTPPIHCPQTSTKSNLMPCWQSSSPQSQYPGLSSISGHGTVNTDPYAMVTVSNVGSLGSITLYDNGTDVWEIGGGDYGLAGPGQAGPGAPLSGYAGSVEGTVGQVTGALDMQGLASGTGYLDLEAREIQGAQPAGTGNVDGVPVTIYRLSESGLQDPDTNGLTSEQASTIRAADQILKESGFAGKTTWVSVDSEGYIREQKTRYSLPDGSTVTSDTILSNFGCAGTVLMPGQQGSSAPPSGCVSPDHASTGSEVSPVPTSASGAASTTTTIPATTSTTQASSVVVPSRPTALAVGPNGNLFIADQTRNQILERLPNGRFVVEAGTGPVGDEGDGGPAVDAELDRPGGMAFGAEGTLFFADVGNGRVRAISPTGTISTVVGSGASSVGGFVPGGTPALDAAISPNDVAFDAGGHLTITAGEQVLRLNADGTLSVIVGTDGPDQGVDGVGGQASSASADGADGLAFDSSGNLYFFGFGSKAVFVIQPSGVLTEPAGAQGIYPRGDAGLATAPNGGIVAMDELSVVRLSQTGEQTIISFAQGLFHGIRGFSPNGIAVGADGTIYVDTFYGNGFTDRTALVSISADGASSQVLWEAPFGNS